MELVAQVTLAKDRLIGRVLEPGLPLRQLVPCLSEIGRGHTVSSEPTLAGPLDFDAHRVPLGAGGVDPHEIRDALSPNTLKRWLAVYAEEGTAMVASDVERVVATGEETRIALEELLKLP